jgi:hypothetical protein
MNNRQIDFLRAAERKFPGLSQWLWVGNVIHGERLLNMRIGNYILMADVGDALIMLAESGILKPTAFRPSHSGAAFLGLSACNKRRERKGPTRDDAAHWEWECLVSADGYKNE